MFTKLFYEFAGERLKRCAADQIGKARAAGPGLLFEFVGFYDNHEISLKQRKQLLMRKTLRALKEK